MLENIFTLNFVEITHALTGIIGIKFTIITKITILYVIYEVGIVHRPIYIYIQDSANFIRHLTKLECPYIRYMGGRRIAVPNVSIFDTRSYNYLNLIHRCVPIVLIFRRVWKAIVRFRLFLDRSCHTLKTLFVHCFILFFSFNLFISFYSDIFMDA